MITEGYAYSPHAESHTKETLAESVKNHVTEKVRTYSNARERRQAVWLECWARYLSTPEAKSRIQSLQLWTVGNVETVWRHNLTRGKAYEVVETIVAYLWQATFPNKDWFDAIPQEKESLEEAKLIREFTKNKLDQANFVSSWNMFLRQLCITGLSVMALPWRTQKELELQGYTKGAKQNGYPEFEVLDVFDCYTDPNAIDPNKSDFVRRIIRSRADVAKDVESGYYENISLLDVANLTQYYGAGSTGESDRRTVKEFQGITVDIPYSWTDHVAVYEYWGDLYVDGTAYYNMHAVVVGPHLVRFEKNPFKHGKPFIIGTYTPLNRSNVAFGAIEPVMGMIHETDIVMNQRLDNLEVSVNSMWELVGDGSLKAEDVYTAPGKVFSVEQQGTITPIRNPSDYQINYTEGSVLEGFIDQTVGSVSPINGGSVRDAERVTATEVREQKNAGGNRLACVHKHIESTALLPLLAKVFESFKQFIRKPEVIRVLGPDVNYADYVRVTPDLFKTEVVLKPYGADHVIERDYKSKQLMQFLQAVLPVPQFAERLNFDVLLRELARSMNINNYEQIINGGQQQPAAGNMMTNGDMLNRELYEMGGKPMQDAVNQQMQVDGGQGLMNELNPNPEGV